jgi:hypothetical protein
MTGLGRWSRKPTGGNRMKSFGKALSTMGFARSAAFTLSGSDQKTEAQQRGLTNARVETRLDPDGRQQIGDALLRHQQGARQRRRSRRSRRHGCALLAAGSKRKLAGDHTWRAYLSTEATATTPAVNARDRIDGGPRSNAGGDLIAPPLAALRGQQSKLAKDTAVTEVSDEVSAASHEILTGSRSDRTALPGNAQRTCNNRTSSGAGSAQVGYSDRKGPRDQPKRLSASSAAPPCSTASQSISGISSWRRPDRLARPYNFSDAAACNPGPEFALGSHSLNVERS